jgi:pre-rRNA-processing protein RIX1
MRRLCILTLTSIYIVSYQYQTLIREITNSTLPTFVSSCLSLVSSKPAGRVLGVPPSLMEPLFEAFSALIPRHPTIFRPYINQIRLITRPYLAPTVCDGRFVPSSVSKSARRVAVLTYQAAAKNSSGEEWGNAVRELIKKIHSTTDRVYRSVIEDWESTCGYNGSPVDMDQELHGGGGIDDDFPTWNGINAGLERLVGLLRQLEEFFKNRTSSAVTIPLGSVIDLLSRLMSIVPPKSLEEASEYGAMRLHPAVGRNERDGLWAGLPSVHIASMRVYTVLVDCLQRQFTSLAQNCLDQLTWTFPSGLPDETFRATSYRLVIKLLQLCGFDLSKKAVDNLTPILRACCREFLLPEGDAQASTLSVEGARQRPNATPRNTGSFPQLGAWPHMHYDLGKEMSDGFEAANELLPLFLSHLPQQHLEAYLRAELDRTAIIYQHKEAMIASVLNPYVRKDCRSLPSILPHLCRQFPSDDAIETLLRPRLPVLQQVISTPNVHERIQEEHLGVENDTMEDVISENSKDEEIDNTDKWLSTREDTTSYSVNALNESVRESMNKWGKPVPGTFEQPREVESYLAGRHNFPLQQPNAPNQMDATQGTSDLVGREEDSDSSEESIHLTMAMSDSEESVT